MKISVDGASAYEYIVDRVVLQFTMLKIKTRTTVGNK